MLTNLVASLSVPCCTLFSPCRSSLMHNPCSLLPANPRVPALCSPPRLTLLPMEEASTLPSQPAVSCAVQCSVSVHCLCSTVCSGCAVVYSDCAVSIPNPASTDTVPLTASGGAHHCTIIAQFSGRICLH